LKRTLLRVAGESYIKTMDPALYEHLTFKCKVYIDLPEELAWTLASIANMATATTLEDTFMEKVQALRQVGTSS
jgi:hypothetical protein